MKPLTLFAALLIITCCVTSTWAGGPDSGFFLGGAGNFQRINGTGTWGGYDFSIDQNLSIDEGGPVGLAWNENFLLGIKPIAGYRLNGQLALQVGFALNFTKSSQQVDAETDGTYFYEQGMIVEWQQRSLEILGVFHPNTDLGYFFYAGLELTRIRTDITLFEGVEYTDYGGDIISDGMTRNESDKVSATGFLFGGGLELPTSNKHRVYFISAQYSVTKTDEAFFDTQDFKVDVGGFSFMIGMKWFPSQS